MQSPSQNVGSFGFVNLDYLIKFKDVKNWKKVCFWYGLYVFPEKYVKIPLLKDFQLFVNNCKNDTIYMS